MKFLLTSAGIKNATIHNALVDFALLPHLDHKDHPESSTAKVERMAADVPVPIYAIDDETAIKVVDGAIEVVSEGHWKRFAP